MLQRARGMFLMSGGAGSLDMDYTTALNLFLRKGLKEFFKDSLDDDDLRYLVANDKAKLEITHDQLEEMKKRLSSLAEDVRLDEAYQRVHEPKTDSDAK